MVRTRCALILLCLAALSEVLGPSEGARFTEHLRGGRGFCLASSSEEESRAIELENDRDVEAAPPEADEPAAIPPDELVIQARLNALQKYKLLAYFGPLFVNGGERSEILHRLLAVRDLLRGDHRLFETRLKDAAGSDGDSPLAGLGLWAGETWKSDTSETLRRAAETVAKGERPLHRRPIVLPPPLFSNQKGQLPPPLTGNSDFFSIGKATSHSESILHSGGVFTRAPRGEPIRAIFRGTVIYAQWLKEYGQVMIIDHGEHYCSLIAHADRLLKKVDDNVERGEVIATVGKTGTLKVPGLYFEIRHHGSPVDPHEWLRADTTSRE